MPIKGSRVPFANVIEIIPIIHYKRPLMPAGCIIPTLIQCFYSGDLEQFLICVLRKDEMA